MTTAGWLLVIAPVVLLTYTYAAYPIILRLLARRLVPSQPPRSTVHGELPLVSIVVPAYNEEAQIRGAIEALIAQDYSPDRRQILILSDASTDRTDEIVSEYRDRGVELLRMPVRGGKTAAENASCPLLRGEIVVNSDASVRLDTAAVRRLVEAMSDPQVGVASTRDVSVTRGSAASNVAEAGYVGYEMSIRQLETLTGGIVGASGSGYAIRAQLHRIPVRDDLSRDFSAALNARQHGYSAVSVEDAICYVPRTTALKDEYRRKVRTISRGVETLIHHRHLLDPIRYGLFSWKLLSHKVFRWMIPVSAIAGLLGLILLGSAYRWPVVVFGVVTIGAVVSLIGALWPVSRRVPRPLSVLTFSVAANVAVIHALWRVAFGHEDHVWEPTRRLPSASET